MKTNIRKFTHITAKEPVIDGLIPRPTKSSGVLYKRTGRYEIPEPASGSDGWKRPKETKSSPKFQITLTKDKTKKIISRNSFLDVPFDRSINPYSGCEFGSIYCFARPTHAYLGLTPGLNFSTKFLYKLEASRLLERELRKANYQCHTVGLIHIYGFTRKAI